MNFVSLLRRRIIQRQLGELFNMAGRKRKAKKDKKTENLTRSRSVTPERHGDPNVNNGNEAEMTVTTPKNSSVKRKAALNSNQNTKKYRMQVSQDQTETEAVFMEDDQLVHISAQGQDTEYASEDDDQSLGDSEVCFKDRSLNNNATVHNRADNYDQPRENEICEDVRPGVSNVRNSIEMSERNEIIGEAIGQALSQVKDLIANSGFIETANKLQEQLKRQERQIAESLQDKSSVLERDAKQHKSKEAVNKGNALNITGTNSEITIYKNAVQDATKRDSSLRKK